MSISIISVSYTHLDVYKRQHPDVFNILLQILEDGILTDGQGRHVDFKNTIIIMTSNIGAQKITGSGRKSLGFADGKPEDAAERTFEPVSYTHLDVYKRQ